MVVSLSPVQTHTSECPQGLLEKVRKNIDCINLGLSSSSFLMRSPLFFIQMAMGPRKGSSLGINWGDHDSLLWSSHLHSPERELSIYINQIRLGHPSVSVFRTPWSINQCQSALCRSNHSDQCFYSVSIMVTPLPLVIECLTLGLCHLGIPSFPWICGTYFNGSNTNVIPGPQ